MYIPNAQSVLTAGLAMTGMLSEPREVTKGSVLDYAVEKCLDADGNTRCTKPFLAAKSTCYRLEWSTKGALTHTTAEVRDAGSGEIVYYRDTNGEWTPEKGELVYLDFKPKVLGTGNNTVDQSSSTCHLSSALGVSKTWGTTRPIHKADPMWHMLVFAFPRTLVEAGLRLDPQDEPCPKKDEDEDEDVGLGRTRLYQFFEEPVDRTALTRKNLDAAELRCSKLETLLRSLNPDLDIEAAIANLESSTASEFHPDPDAGPDRESDQGEERGEARYEWHEDTLLRPAPVAGAQESPQLQHQEDGMANFSTSESGYLGSSSGSSLLQEIGALVPRAAAGGSMSHVPPDQSSPSTANLDRADLATSAVASLLIDAYFLFYNTSYPIVHEKIFREKMASDWRHTKRHSAWSIVYYMVLAIGHWTSATNHTSVMPCPYYSAARSRLSVAMLESGTVETLQAFLLMGNYLQKRDRPNTGYNLIGIAYRIAFGLGLHREIPHAADTMEHERRRQLFWTVYCFDSGFCITTGRPPTLVDGFLDLRLPRNVEEDSHALGSEMVREVDHPTPSSAIVANAELAKIATTLYTEFLMAKTAGARVEYQVAEAIDKSLNTWKQALPSYFTSPDVPSWFSGPRAVLLWKQENLRLLLWRGTKRRHPFLLSKPDGEQRCAEIAMQSINDITSFCEQPESMLHLGISWYATYFLFQATLVLEIINSIQDNLSASASWRTQRDFNTNSFQTEDPEHPPTQSRPSYDMFSNHLANDSVYWNEFGFGDGDATGDPTIHMLMDQTPLDIFLSDSN
ncbi:hypothetical protein JX265_009078 [Neoarthrinium moseri]|uniref:Xylanolytic transcriptional activator regulatory domain-containing protein n=1 Tax=Neoarthrinium moseri TaxID=1658444 RepID=A0A9Q0AN45_9PEZI|nr:hypothetical protein JX265_009078 [Neoarthrinium moseri]